MVNYISHLLIYNASKYSFHDESSGKKKNSEKPSRIIEGIIPKVQERKHISEKRLIKKPEQKLICILNMIQGSGGPQ